MANVELCPDVTDILSRSLITENLLVLPAGVPEVPHTTGTTTMIKGN